MHFLHCSQGSDGVLFSKPGLGAAGLVVASDAVRDPVWGEYLQDPGFAGV